MMNSAAGHPEIVLSTVRSSNAVRLRCDLSPTGTSWGFDAWRSIGRMLYQLYPVEGASWLFTEQELQLDGLAMEEAIGIARRLLDLATATPLPPSHQQTPPSCGGVC